METAPLTPPTPDPFELSIGYNYIHLGDASFETEHLHGVDLSFFYSLVPRIALGADFMANFGSTTDHVFFGTVEVDSERYVYVFGPRVTLWQDRQFKIFGEVLAGGVHAAAKAKFEA